MNKESINTLVITTKENFSWISMQEIIPEIELCWLSLNSYKNHNVKIINIDDGNIFSNLQDFFNADQIILTAFNYKIAKLSEKLRGDLSISCRIIFYLHGMTSLACWPMLHFGMKNVFTSNDLFISTCERDAKALSLTFKDACVDVIPFSLNPIELEPSSPPIKLSFSLFVFIGRVSQQKNLHTLLLSFFLYRKRINKAFKIIIYGDNDGLGSPNMERESIDYKAYLMSLVKSLDLEDYVEFRGFVKREIIYSELNSIEYVFISLSLHSDENFGMAALRSLSDGKKAILSNWGGHADFDKSFPNQVLLIDVEGGSDGPYIDPVSVISSIEECCHFIPLEINAIPKKYQRESITARLKAISEKISSLPLVALKHSAWAEAILQKRNSFALNKLGKGTKIFNDYCDQKSHLFFSVYGMGDNAIKPITYDLYLIPPWVKISNDIITIEDPHKGFFQIEMTAPTDNEILVKIVTINDSIVLITQSNCLKLIQSGHAFPFGDKND